MELESEARLSEEGRLRLGGLASSLLNARRRTLARRSSLELACDRLPPDARVGDGDPVRSAVVRTKLVAAPSASKGAPGGWVLGPTASVGVRGRSSAIDTGRRALATTVAVPDLGTANGSSRRRKLWLENLVIRCMAVSGPDGAREGAWGLEGDIPDCNRCLDREVTRRRRMSSVTLCGRAKPTGTWSEFPKPAGSGSEVQRPDPCDSQGESGSAVTNSSGSIEVGLLVEDELPRVIAIAGRG